MAEVINDTMITEMEGTDDETRVFPVSVIDVRTSKTGFGYMVYDTKNSLIKRVGFKTGLVQLDDGSTISGDTLTTGISQFTREKIKDYVMVAQSKSEVDDNG